MQGTSWHEIIAYLEKIPSISRDANAGGIPEELWGVRRHIFSLRELSMRAQQGEDSVFEEACGWLCAVADFVQARTEAPPYTAGNSHPQ